MIASAARSLAEKEMERMRTSINDVLYPIDAAIAWTAFLFKLVSLRKSRDPAAIALCMSFGFLGIVYTISTPVVWVTLGSATGIPNLAALLSQGFVILYTGSVQAMLLFWFHPRLEAWRNFRTQAAFLFVVLLAMSTLFALTPATTENSQDFVATYAHIPTYSLYLLVYLTAYSITQFRILRLSWRYAPVAGQFWLRRGLLILGIGTVLALVYSAARTADVLGAVVGWDPKRWENVARLGAGIGTIVTLIGLTIPSWGRYLSRAGEWFGQQRAYRQLHPLWSALHGATPGIALNPPRFAWLGRFTMRDVKYKLTRRVVEIRDGRLALRSHLDTRIEQSARQVAAAFDLDEEELRAAVEATVLLGAVRAKEHGQLPSEQSLIAMSGSGDEMDMSAEVRWLVKVSQAYNRSPVVPAAMAAVDDPRSARQEV